MKFNSISNGLLQADAQGNVMVAPAGSFGAGLWQYGTGANSSDIYNTNSGNVGIGTNNPEDKFQIGGGAARINLSPAENSEFLGWGTSYIGFNAHRNATNQQWIIHTDCSHNGGAAIWGTITGDIYFSSKGNTQTGSSDCNYPDQVISDNNMKLLTKLKIDNNGDIGIGTTSPTSKLHVKVTNDSDNGFTLSNSNYNGSNTEKDVFQVWGDGRVSLGGDPYIPSGYKLAIRGKAIAEEFLVKLESNGWPDYVFNKNYQLKDLNALKTYIKKYNHLPGVPTAGEIKASGISLGEIAKTQMEKIEELTLYLIQLKEDVNALKKENEILKASIKR